MSRQSLALAPVETARALYQEITDKIIAELEAGRVPWVRRGGTAAAKASLNLLIPQAASVGDKPAA